jgi:hypothetical protein
MVPEVSNISLCDTGPTTTRRTHSSTELYINQLSEGVLLAVVPVSSALLYMNSSYMSTSNVRRPETAGTEQIATLTTIFVVSVQMSSLLYVCKFWYTSAVFGVTDFDALLLIMWPQGFKNVQYHCNCRMTEFKAVERVTVEILTVTYQPPWSIHCLSISIGGCAPYSSLAGMLRSSTNTTHVTPSGGPSTPCIQFEVYTVYIIKHSNIVQQRGQCIASSSSQL